MFTDTLNYYFTLCFCFQIELLIGEGVLLSKFSKKKNFIIRLIPSIFSIFIFAFFLLMFESNVFSNFSSSIVLISLFFITIWIFTYIPIKFSFDINWKENLFVLIAGYFFQHSVYSILEPFKKYFVLTSIQSSIYFDILPYLSISPLFYFTYAKKIRNNCEIKKHNPNFLIFAFFLLISADVFNVIIQFNNEFNTAGSIVKMISHFYSALVCIAGLCLLYSFTKINRMEQDNQIIELLLENEKKRFIAEKENIEVINRKVHDLKHMMNDLQSSISNNEKNAELYEIEKTLQSFEENIHSGNSTLDCILISRKRICLNEGIPFSIIADGKALNFIEPVDLLSLFSNILDNAIDGVKRANNPTPVGISIKIEKNLNQVFIHEENDCQNDIVFDKENLPITSSKDKNQHGYGMRSIRYLCQKYNGHLHVYIDHNKFILNILLPTK